MTVAQSWRGDLRGGTEAALQGMSTAVSPILLFVGLFGAVGISAGYWAALVVVALVPCVRLLIGGQPAILSAPRTASLATYTGLVLHLSLTSNGSTAQQASGGLTAAQLVAGLTAGSLMFLAASALVLLAGVLRWGHIFKMIPTPVSAGISNGTALLLIWLALVQMGQGGGPAALCAVAMLLAYALWYWLQKRFSWLVNVPAILIAVACGVLVTSLGSTTGPLGAAPQVMAETQWISARMWSTVEMHDLLPLLMAGLPGTITLALVMILETFTTAATMESRFNLRTDANRELIAMGTANMLSATLGGVPCTGGPLYSLASWNAGGRGWLAALTCMLVLTALLLGIAPWLMALPAGLIAGLLLLQVLPMADPAFMERLGRMLRTRQWRGEGSADLGFWITAAISLVGVFGNLIWATFLGIGLSSLAVLKRVSGNLTAQWAYLDTQRSRRVRGLAETTELARAAQSVGVLRLTGHLFFGNSLRLRQQADELDARTRAVVIDVAQVHEVDPSGVEALSGLIRSLQGSGRAVVLSGLQASAPALQRAQGNWGGVDFQADLDRGLETCEEVLLARSAVNTSTSTVGANHNNLMQDLHNDDMQAVLALGERKDVAQGAALFERGAPADGVWLLESGKVSILSGSGPLASRLATFGPGQFVGEMGLIDGKLRSATVTADTAVTALFLDSQAIATLVDQYPAAALAITRNIARELSLRLRGSAL
jgi:SulP family sulfate permease